jgi:hypothetical protein
MKRLQLITGCTVSQVVKSPSLQKDAAWRAVLASKKFVAYER